ncbi:ribonuclease H-like domain-containing protein, partial [Tanacetum coccineum]
LWYEQKIKFMKIDLDDKTDVLTYHKKLLADALKERDDLKTKFKSWKDSSKNPGKLLNTQMSASDKFRLGYGDHRFVRILSYENEVLQSVFINKDNNTDDTTLYDRFVTTDGMHAVPPPMIGNYMSSGPDIEIDDSQFTYGPKQPQSSESETRTSNFDSCESDSSGETSDSLPKPVEIEPNVVNTPKVWTDVPIIEEYESDDDDEYVFTPSSIQEQPRENVQEQNTTSKSPKFNKKDLNRMAKQAEVNKKKSNCTNQRNVRPIWNNVQRINHINQFVPSAVLTRSGKLARTSGTNYVNTARQKVSTARQNSGKQIVPIKTVRKVSAESTNVNDLKSKTPAHTNHSSKRPFSRTTALKTNQINTVITSSTKNVNTVSQNVSTTKGKGVSTVRGIRKTAVKALAGYVLICKQDNPQRALKNKGIVDSGCFRHMTGNKGYLVDYKDYHGGPVTFGGSKGQITGKGKIKIGKLDFDDVCFVKELQQFNLFSVSQICDKKNKVLFTDTECFVLSPDFNLPDENQILLRVPRQHNMYNFNLENSAPSKELTCLIVKATTDESNKWHRRLGHVNFKNLNKLVKGNLVRGLPSKIFQNDHTCIACQKGKQHKTSCKAKSISSFNQPL